MERNWYAVYTKSHCEKKVAALLAKRKIESYCPLNRVVKQWSDRRKLVYQPLFFSYVFAKITEAEIVVIRQTNDVINLFYWLGKPAIIKEVEIENIQRFLDEYTNVHLEKAPVNLVDKVRITSGPLLDAEGNVVSVENNKVRLSLPSLGYLMVAEVKKSNVEVINYSYRVSNLIS